MTLNQLARRTPAIVDGVEERMPNDAIARRRLLIASGAAGLAGLANFASAQGGWPTDTPENQRLAYDLPTIKGWMALFLKRFFANQFKRSALPNGPKISSGGSLSPRGDWRAPSDGSPDVWLEEMKTIPEAGAN